MSWKHLSSPTEELDEVAGEREIWASLLKIWIKGKNGLRDINVTFKNSSGFHLILFIYQELTSVIQSSLYCRNYNTTEITKEKCVSYLYEIVNFNVESQSLYVSLSLLFGDVSIKQHILSD